MRRKLLLILPALQHLPLGAAIREMGIRYLLSVLAVIVLNVGVIGWFGKNLSIVERVVACGGALLLFYPSSNTDVAGCATIAAFLVWRVIAKRRDAARRAVAG